MQAFSTPDDILPGSIRASDQVLNVKCQLPTDLPNNGGDERVFNSRTQQATTPMLNATGGLLLAPFFDQKWASIFTYFCSFFGGTIVPRLQIPSLPMSGITHSSQLAPETLVM
ncbi:hypothetical protein ACOSP7_022354 [Xanthoceras sorbifolium]